MLDIAADRSLFENDFGVTGTFGTDPDTFDLTGMFTAASTGVAMGGNVEVQAAKASFTTKSADVFGMVTTKMPVTVDGDAYLVERIEPCGNGYTVLWLKNSVT